MNELSDWTDDEMDRMLNGIDIDEEEDLFEETEEFHIGDFESDHPRVLGGRIKDSIDWRKVPNVVTEVKK